MCGRFALDENPLRFAEHFNLTGDVLLSPAWNIAPSFKINTITAPQDGARQLRTMRWGLIPAWAKDAAIGNRLSNARGETVADKPSFRSAFKYRRCLIPASGFYEWKSHQGRKQPWYMSLKSGEPMALAGLWESWQAPDGETLQTCCIITTSANSLMQPIHERMPVILNREQWESWLSPQERNPHHVLPFIQPCDAEPMQAWPVSTELNQVGLRDDAGLIAPLSNLS